MAPEVKTAEPQEVAEKRVDPTKTVVAPPLPNKYAAAALKVVNKVRVRCGAKPLDDLPRGLLSDASHCPIANAFRDLPGIVEVDVGDAISLEFHRPGRNQPEWVEHQDEAIGRFVNEFDRNRFPEYVVEQKEQ